MLHTISVVLLPLYMSIIGQKQQTRWALWCKLLVTHICTARQRQTETYSWKALVKLGNQAHHELSVLSSGLMIIFSQHHQLTAKGPLHTACVHDYFFGSEKGKQMRPVVVRVVTQNRRYCRNYCIGRLGVLLLHLMPRYLLEEGWASPMQIYIIRASIGLAVPGLPL